MEDFWALLGIRHFQTHTRVSSRHCMQARPEDMRLSSYPPSSSAPNLIIIIDCDYHRGLRRSLCHRHFGTAAWPIGDSNKPRRRLKPTPPFAVFVFDDSRRSPVLSARHKTPRGRTCQLSRNRHPRTVPATRGHHHSTQNVSGGRYKRQLRRLSG